MRGWMGLRGGLDTEAEEKYIIIIIVKIITGRENKIRS
jgi:hypothetical protein